MYSTYERKRYPHGVRNRQLWSLVIAAHDYPNPVHTPSKDVRGITWLNAYLNVIKAEPSFPELGYRMTNKNTKSGDKIIANVGSR